MTTLLALGVFASACIGLHGPAPLLTVESSQKVAHMVFMAESEFYPGHTDVKVYL